MTSVEPSIDGWDLKSGRALDEDVNASEDDDEGADETTERQRERDDSGTDGSDDDEDGDDFDVEASQRSASWRRSITNRASVQLNVWAATRRITEIKTLPDSYLERGHYTEADKHSRKRDICCSIVPSLLAEDGYLAAQSLLEVPGMIRSLGKPRRSQLRLSHIDTAYGDIHPNAYPPFVNLNILRVVDFMSAVGMLISALLTAFNLATYNAIEDHKDKEALRWILYGFEWLLFVVLLLDKVIQVKQLPEWKVERAIAFRVFGPQFVPAPSSARRAQQFIFGFEMLFTSPIFVYLLFGENSVIGLWYILAWKTFLATVFFSMAFTVTCPAWSMTGYFVRLGLVPAPRGDLTDHLLRDIDTGNRSHGGHHCTVEGHYCSSIRYGRYGPLEENLKSSRKT